MTDDLEDYAIAMRFKEGSPDKYREVLRLFTSRAAYPGNMAYARSLSLVGDPGIVRACARYWELQEAHERKAFLKRACAIEALSR